MNMLLYWMHVIRINAPQGGKSGGVRVRGDKETSRANRNQADSKLPGTQKRQSNSKVAAKTEGGSR